MYETLQLASIFENKYLLWNPWLYVFIGLIITIAFFKLLGGDWSDTHWRPRLHQADDRRSDAQVAAVGSEATQHGHRHHRQGGFPCQMAESHQRHGTHRTSCT